MFSEGLQPCPHAIVSILVSVEMGYPTRGGSMGGLALSPHNCEQLSVAGKRGTCLGDTVRGFTPSPPKSQHQIGLENGGTCR